jgi:hypothetical protein
MASEDSEDPWTDVSCSIRTEVIVRVLVLGVLFLGVAQVAVAQCPVLPRHASVDPTGPRQRLNF